MDDETRIELHGLYERGLLSERAVRDLIGDEIDSIERETTAFEKATKRDTSKFIIDENDRQRKLMTLLSQDTRHSIIQALLGHPDALASAAELNHFTPSESKETLEEQLDVLVDAEILDIYESPENKDTRGLPWKFYGFTESGVKILGDFNYLKGVPMARAVHQKTRKPERIERHEAAPRPELPATVRDALRLDEDGE